MNDLCVLCGKPFEKHWISWCTKHEWDTRQYTPPAEPTPEPAQGSQQK